MDAGVLTYNNFSNGNLGLPGSGFASRGKGSHIKRIAVAPPKANAGSGELSNGVATPRTSRGHLLAGLRTAPRNQQAPPPSAPPTQLYHDTGLSDSKFAQHHGGRTVNAQAMPQTAVGTTFPHRRPTTQSTLPNNRQMYSLPEQVMGPPAIQSDLAQNEDLMDPNLYAELVATNYYLAQQQQRLQQQLLSVTQAAQQFQGMNLNNQASVLPLQQQQQQFAGQTHGQFGQQLNGLGQSVITPVHSSQPGLYTIYNPSTGQQTYYLDPQAQQQTQPMMPTRQSSYDRKSSPPQPETPRLEVSPPPPSNPSPLHFQNNIAPPKSVSPPQTNPSLPPPSMNAFRRGHKKATSLASCVINANAALLADGPKTSLPKNSAIPPTPMTGTFGPGQARSGVHPIRQPRGPPPLEELIAKPTAKIEGSKNFVSRQRKNAVTNLVRAGLERRSGRPSGSTSSAGSTTPVSDDDDSGSASSGGPSHKRSLGSLRAVANGAIGSERKELRERSHERASNGNLWSAKVNGSGTGSPTEGKLETPERRKTPMLILTSAEKRKSSVF